MAVFTKVLYGLYRNERDLSSQPKIYLNIIFPYTLCSPKWCIPAKYSD
jgi:hypothetical protein